MKISYELRTIRNTSVFAFDSIVRAKEEITRAEKRIGTKLRLVKVIQTEEEIEA